MVAYCFVSPYLRQRLEISTRLPGSVDHWDGCFLMEYQIERVLGMNPGGFWEGGYFYPFHHESLLCNEPTWGISMAVLPFWLLTRNIFPLHYLGGIVALILCWVTMYFFAKALGCDRPAAFLASMAFCLSHITLALMLGRYFFWPFFLIPVLAWLIITMLQSQRIIWSVLFGIGFGYLAWSSAHVTAIGGSFLIALALWALWAKGFNRRQFVLICLAFLIGGMLALFVYLPMYRVHRGFMEPSPTFAQLQVLYATNWKDIPYPMVKEGQSLLHDFLRRFSFSQSLFLHPKGETPIGISLTLLLFSLYLVGSQLYSISKIKIAKPTVSPFRIFFYYCLPLALIIVNILVLRRAAFWVKPDIFQTVCFYYGFGALIIFFRNRVSIALHQLPFFFFFLSLVSVFLAYGPYFPVSGGKAIPSPLIFIQCYVPGFNGIRAVPRWGLLASFGISLGAALAFTQAKGKGVPKVLIGVILLLCFYELSPGFSLKRLPSFTFYRWQPRTVDIFLKNLPGKGAVLELASYPVDHEAAGPEMYAHLYHHKPIVTGYGRVFPPLITQYIYQANTSLTVERIGELRKFGARYWVFHMDAWPAQDMFEPKDDLGGLRLMVSLDNGKTLIYEDPAPKVAVEDLKEKP